MRKNRILGFVVLAAAIGTIGSAAAQPWKDLPAKEAFAERVYPRYFTFRGEMSRPTHTNYQVWWEAFGDASGLMRKLAFEEIPINPNTPEWANRYAKEHPEKLVMIHLNGEARQVSKFPDVLKRYFPGHWVYQPGSMAVGAISAKDKEIAVRNAKPFTLNGYIDRRTTPRSYLPQRVIIVRVNAQGQKLWYESEYATVKAVDYDRGTITLERGQYFTKPLSYAAGEAYIAPIAGGLWGEDVMWYYNLSTACPRDRNGKQAADVFADEICSWFSPKGVLRNVQGIAFDVNYFNVEERGDKWDTDNDGKADGGWSATGENLWREGDWKFLSGLRQRLGRDFILSADAQHPTNQQAVGVMDGMESEGLVQHDDMWRGFSRAVNTHLYWKAHNTSRYDYRYVVLKLNGPDEQNPEQMRRFGAAAACCLEAYVTNPMDRNFMPEQFRAPGALGGAQGELIRCARQGEDLLALEGEALRSRIDAPGCEVSVRDGKVYLKAKAGTGERNLKFSIREVDLPAGDLTFFLEARAVDPLEGFTQEDRVPRIVWLRPRTLPDYGEGSHRNDYFTSIYGLMGVQSPEMMSYYFRDVAAGPQPVDVEVSGCGEIELSRLELYHEPDVIARRFDRGVVVVNPSQHEVTVEVSALFPSLENLPDQTVVPAVDAAFIAID